MGLHIAMGAQPWAAQLRALGGLGYEGHDPIILGGHSPLHPSGASCWVSVANPTGSCLASEGFLSKN